MKAIGTWSEGGLCITCNTLSMVASVARALLPDWVHCISPNCFASPRSIHDWSDTISYANELCCTIPRFYAALIVELATVESSYMLYVNEGSFVWIQLCHFPWLHRWLLWKFCLLSCDDPCKQTNAPNMGLACWCFIIHILFEFLTRILCLAPLLIGIILAYLLEGLHILYQRQSEVNQSQWLEWMLAMSVTSLDASHVSVGNSDTGP